MDAIVRYDLKGFSVRECPVCGGDHENVNFYPHGEEMYLGICPSMFGLIRMTAEKEVYDRMLRNAGAT